MDAAKAMKEAMKIKDIDQRLAALRAIREAQDIRLAALYAERDALAANSK